MTLMMRDQENQRIGRKEGRREGIYAMISALKDLCIPEAVILQKLQEKFALSEEEAKTYLE